MTNTESPTDTAEQHQRTKIAPQTHWYKKANERSHGADSGGDQLSLQIEERVSGRAIGYRN